MLLIAWLLPFAEMTFAVLGVAFFREAQVPIEGLTARGMSYNDEYWGNWLKAMYTLFQAWTLESWSEAIARPLVFSEDWYVTLAAAIYFPLFNFLNSVFLINVLVSVFVDVYTVQSATEREEKEEREYEAQFQAAISGGAGAVSSAADMAHTKAPALAPAFALDGTGACAPAGTAASMMAATRPPRRLSTRLNRLGSIADAGTDALLHERINSLASSVDERVRAVEGQMASVVGALDRLHAVLRVPQPDRAQAKAGA